MKANTNLLLMYNRRRISCILLSFLVTFFLAIFSISAGTISYPLQTIFSVLLGNNDNPLARNIIFDIRLPRILTALLVGMNLALAGGLLQGLLRNPLASPQVIGVNAGAGLAAVLIMVCYPGKIALVPVAAFGGALLAVMLVYGLSAVNGKGAESDIILAGMCIAALLTAFTSGIMILHSDELEVTFSWLIGGLTGRGWSYFHMLWPYSLSGVCLALLLCPKVNLFMLGEEVGQSLGLAVGFYRALIMLVAAVLAGSAVSVAGTIGFIGLIAPHMARLLVGADYRYLMILAGLLGAALLLLADTAARTMFQPVEVPVGIITATIGAPFFLYLLFHKRLSKNNN